jgi:hypothetical protein
MADPAKMVQALLAQGKYDQSAFAAYMRHACLSGSATSAATDPAMIHRVLLRALLHYRTNDYTMLLCMLPYAKHNTMDMLRLAQIDSAIEGGRFAEAWKLLADGRAEASADAPFLGVPKAEEKFYDDALRRAAVLGFSHAFVSAPAAELLRAMNLTDAKEVAAYADAGVIDSIDATTVTFKKTETNTPPPPTAPRELLSSDFTKLVETLQH